jgi:hypothetical protein
MSSDEMWMWESERDPRWLVVQWLGPEILVETFQMPRENHLVMLSRLRQYLWMVRSTLQFFLKGNVRTFSMPP